jgi:hypothetical protein
MNHKSQGYYNDDFIKKKTFDVLILLEVDFTKLLSPCKKLLVQKITTQLDVKPSNKSLIFARHSTNTIPSTKVSIFMSKKVD